MNNQIVQKGLFYVAVAVVFMLFAAIFSSPEFSGKVLAQGDVQQARGMQTEWRKYHEKGEWINWTDQAFVGTPTYLIQGVPDGNYLRYIPTFLMFNNAPSSLFAIIYWSALMCFLGASLAGFNRWVAAAGGLIFGFMTHNTLLVEAGHTSKVLAITYMIPILGSMIAVFRGKYWAGALLALFLSLQIKTSHVQITFYLSLVVGIYALIELVKALKEKQLAHYAKVAVIVALSYGVGVFSNLGQLWATQEFSKDTIRGQSDLESKGKRDGLDKGYAFSWSYGKFESFNLLVPSLVGGSSGNSFLENESSATSLAVESAQKSIQQSIQKAVKDGQLNQQQAQEEYKKQMGSLQQATSQYWGPQSGTSGPIYYGAVLCFLFFLGLVIVRNPLKWAFGAGTFLLIMLSWGENFQALNYFLFDHIPLFNKFRAVSMALAVGQASAMMLGLWGLQELVTSQEITPSDKMRKLFIAGGITAGIAALLILWSFVSKAESLEDADFKTAFGVDFVKALQSDRASLLRADALRSIVFIALAFGCLWAYLKNYIKPKYAIIALAFVGLTDFWLHNTRYINEQAWKDKKEVTEPQPTNADKLVMKDPDPHYRVLDLTRGNPLSSAMGAYFHKILGGYNAAKPLIFQEWADEYFLKNNRFVFSYNMPQLGMLNVKYILQDANQPYPLPDALGNAWFVDSVLVAPSADKELAALASMDLRRQGVVQEKYAEYVKSVAALPKDSTASIKLTSYHPEKLAYESNSAVERLALFSELYYAPEKGWRTFIDNQEVKDGFIKANYLLRGLKVPAGKHTIEMRFEPRSVILGSKISLITATLILLACLFAGFMLWKKRQEWMTDKSPDEELVEFQVEAPVLKTEMQAKPTGNRKSK